MQQPSMSWNLTTAADCLRSRFPVGPCSTTFTINVSKGSWTTNTTNTNTSGIRSIRRLEFRIDEGATIDREINLSGGLGVRGTVSGIRTGERAMVFAFRGKFHLGKNRSSVVLSQKFRLALGTAEVRGDGPFVLEGLERGRVTILAIAYDPGVKDGASLDVRIARKELDLQAKGVATMELVLE